MHRLLLASVLLLTACGDSADDSPSTAASTDSVASEDSVTADSVPADSSATDTSSEDTGVASDHLYILHGGTTAPATIDLCMKASSATSYTDPPVLKSQGLAPVPFKGMSHAFDAPAVAKTGAVSLRIIDGATGDCTVATSLGDLPSESFFVNRLLVVGSKSMRTTAPGYGEAMFDTLTYEQVVDGIDLSFVPSSGAPTSLSGAGTPVSLMAGATGKLVSTKGERPFKAEGGGRVFALAFDDGITLCDISRPAVGGLTDCSADLRKP